MEEKKTNWGGVRVGAGRKKVKEKIKYISKSISLPAEKWDKLEELAGQKEMTKNKLVAELIEKYLENKEID